MELFYLSDKFYWESGSAMSPIYQVGTLIRSDWGKIQCYLEDGDEVHIRPATDEEFGIMQRCLDKIKRERGQ